MTVTNSEEYKQFFNSYAEDMRKEAHQAVYTGIPHKIKHLRHLMEISPLINSAGISHVHRISPAKRTAGSERDPSSSKKRRIENEVKGMEEDTNESVKQLHFNLLYIDDGRTFAKLVHESIFKELTAAEDSALAIADSIHQYFSKRATLVTSCVQHKRVQDFQEAVKELDALEWLHIKSTFNDLSLTYVVLFTRITKAWTVLEPHRP
ncbi:uncharacterized protein SPPG_04576 [Spizellomyces punctatus DAOM BR117]|uniref:Proteasome activator PA28 C-terminal domain-containing protein n=1 Tax=Spizellomyces punctatus (strain DAOM BR117) TaxID=645134 RepID=A0A0L0HH86_SPIPD|nr:uncharacterized protein SPPG_04576 [Spizellomyces punctatus DAOM BR117]KND00245.1 hypothetical protein SPPG_04576 [Spizellomyces punctatus DAOM BR117]|eukprot:XP_016608284.1 hypothetical protein SPPG_04576 [Spizellomyces punctatus DAOM BR117]